MPANPAKGPSALPRCWRLRNGRHVRDVAVYPGSRLWWLSLDFDRLFSPITIRAVGQRGRVDLCGLVGISSREFHATRKSAEVALARRTANDVRRGRRESCPECSQRHDSQITALRGGRLRCVGCHHEWKPTRKAVRK